MEAGMAGPLRTASTSGVMDLRLAIGQLIIMALYIHTIVLPKCQRLGLGGRPRRPTRSCFLFKLAPKGRAVAMSGTGNHDASDLTPG